jgi:hypothetical protein
MDYDYDYFLTYNWPEIPQHGDRIHIKENDVFEVKSRLLPSTEISNRVVLFGDVVPFRKQTVFMEKH